MHTNTSQFHQYRAKIIYAVVSIILDCLLIVFVNPDEIISVVGSIGTVSLFIGFQGIVAYTISSLFLPMVDKLLVSTAIVIFLTMTYLFGFQLLNTILLVLFIIIVRFILSKDTASNTQNK